MGTLILAVILMLLGSGFFSATEAALFSTSLNEAKILRDKRRKGSDSLVAIKKDMRPTITVLVIFTNIFNIAGSVLVGSIAGEVFGSAKIGIFSATLTFLVILFAEIIPKSIGETFSSSISLFLSRPLLYMTKIFSPFIRFIEVLTGFLPQKKRTVSEEEIRTLSNIGFSEGVIEEDEKEMIHKVFLLNDLRTEDIMTPRTAVTALEAKKSLQEAKEGILHSNHSRIPVYEENLDHIKGICHQRDLLIALSQGSGEKKIQEFAEREVTRISEKKKIDDLIPIFKRQRCHLAIVTSKSGKITGVVTLEDVLEQIIGDVVDETDDEVTE